VEADGKLSLQRANRVKNSLVAMFFTQAVVLMSIIIRIPELIDKLNLTKNLTIWGTITGFSGAGGLLSLFVVHRLVNKFGTTTVTRIATLVTCAIQGIVVLLGNYWLYFIATFVQAIFITMYNNSANAQALIVQKRLKKVILGSIHGAWSLGVVVATMISGWLASFLTLEWHIGIIAALGFAVNVVLGTQMMTRAEEKANQTKQKNEKKTSWLKTPGLVWLLSFTLFAGIWPEAVMGDWMSLYSTKVMNLTTSLVAVPFTAFAIAMIIGRFSTGWVSTKIHINRAAMFGGYFGAISMTIGLLTSYFLLPINQLLAVAVQALFFFIAGLGESIMVPATFSAASHIRGIASSQALARISLGSNLSFIVAKSVMGSLADGVGLAIAMIFPIVIFFISGYLQSIVATKSRKLEAQNLENYPPTGSVPIVEA
jgi:MFS family permease